MTSSEHRPVTLLGVGYDETGDIAVMVLREVGGDRVLPIWISGHEGGVIERLAAPGRPSRPATHEALVEVVHAFGRVVTDGVVTGVADGVFRAEIHFDGDVRVDARPSDMVRVALTVDAPMHVDPAVLDAAGMSLDGVDPAPRATLDGTAGTDAAGNDVTGTTGAGTGEAPSSVEIDARAALFRAWLDTARVEDFGRP